MPNFSTIPLLSTPANISLPGTSSSIGEFPILVGAFQRNSLVATSAALGMILGAAYPLWPHNRVVFGNSKPKFLHRFSDLNRREVLTFLPSIPGEATVKPPSKCIAKQCNHNIVGARDETEATYLNGKHSLLRKKGARPLSVRPSLFDRVSKGQLNGLLMNARLDEPMTRTRSVRLLSNQSYHSVISTIIWTPSIYGRARGVSNFDTEPMLKAQLGFPLGLTLLVRNLTLVT